MSRILRLFVFIFTLIAPIVVLCDTPQLENQDQTQQMPNFKPDIHIKEQLPEDYTVLRVIKKMFYEADGSAEGQRVVYRKAVQEYGGQEVMLLTEDDFRISALYFKRKNAPINIIDVTGYFNDQTPTKEWCAPFGLLFPEFNLLSFDWRGFGGSEGRSGLTTLATFQKNSFGNKAFPDIQAAIDFMAKENDKPIILVGFCFGAAMVLKATVEALEYNMTQKDQSKKRRLADGLVLNCIFTKFRNQFDRSVIAEDRWYMRPLLQLGIGEKLLEWMATGSLFDINPIEMIKDIKDIPVYFEHFTYDPFAILSEGIEVYQAATCPKMFMQSDMGRHVRIHGKVPYQYRNSFLEFLQRFGFLHNSFAFNKYQQLTDFDALLKLPALRTAVAK